MVGYHLLEPRHLRELAGPPVVFYQLEQLSEREGWFTPARAQVLRAASRIWDYSAENVAFLKARGFAQVEHLPIGFHPALERIRHRDEADKDIDVLFYGSVNLRRQGVLEPIRRRLRLQTLFGVYGEARDQHIARSKIVLNIHFYQTRILEQVRLAYLFNNRCFVVSEEAEQNSFGNGLVSGPAGELGELCARYLADPEARRQSALANYRAFQKQPMTEYLKPLLEAAAA